MTGRIVNALRWRLRHRRYRREARRQSRDHVAEHAGRKLLVLCYGNIYRSPFVAARLAGRLGPAGWSVRSSGFFPREGRACVPAHIEMAAGHGVHLQNHRSSAVDREALEWADLVVIMDGHNFDMLREFGEEFASKVVWIAAFLEDGPPDIEDPYGLSEAEARRIVERLVRASDALASVLESRVSYGTS